MECESWWFLNHCLETILNDTQNVWVTIGPGAVGGPEDPFPLTLPLWLTPCSIWDDIVRRATDPNEKGVIAQRFIQPDQPLVYPIHFENIGDVEAQDVFVTDVLDPNLDASTAKILTPGGSLEEATRAVRWDLLGINLRPGESSNVLLAVKPRPGLPSGTEIRNRADIRFEVFETFTTNEVVNVIDSTPPACVVAPLPASSPARSVSLAWTGADAIGEVRSFTILASVDGGAFMPFLVGTTETSAGFEGEPGRTYGFLCIATDTAGNVEVQSLVAEASTTVATDDTGPVITVELTPAPNADGWNDTDVTATWSVSDSESGITSSEGCGPTLAGESSGTTLTCRATNGAGLSSFRSVLVKIDKTPPVITGARTPEANASGWNSTDVTVTFTCADGLSGVDACGPTPQAIMIEGAAQSRTGTATDRAGNSASATVAGINIDKAPPVISGLPTGPCALWPPEHRLVQVATVTASDGLSGLASGSPAATGTSNEPEDGLGDGDVAPDILIGGGAVELRAERSGKGTGRIYTVTAGASDRAGNSATSTAICTVPYDRRER